MKSLTDEQRKALGLSADASVEVEGTHSPRDSGVALGFSSAGSSEGGSLAALKPLLASTTPIADFAVTASRMGEGGASVQRSDLVPGVFVVSPGELSVDVAGEAIHDRDLWVIDTRKGDVLLRLAGPSGEAVLSFEGSMFAWGRVDSMVSPELQSLAAWTPPARPSLASPGAEALLGGLDAPAWITALLDPSLRLDPYATVAAVGTLGRLWSPRGTATPIAAAMARVRANDDPLARAIRWARALTIETCVAVSELARLEVDTLAEALETMGSQDEDRADARDWLERRDDLASVFTLLNAAGQGGALRSWLEGLDNHARTHATMWGALSPVASPRLAAVAWQEPDAWWAACSAVS
jgi:hypothetical protein